MEYSKNIEKRIESILEDREILAKKKMFGGMAFMFNDNICFGIHKDFFILRTTPDHAKKLLEDHRFREFDITGRPMKGWVMMAEDDLPEGREFFDLLQAGISLAASLPAR